MESSLALAPLQRLRDGSPSEWTYDGCSCGLVPLPHSREGTFDPDRESLRRHNSSSARANRGRPVLGHVGEPQATDTDKCHSGQCPARRKQPRVGPRRKVSRKAFLWRTKQIRSERCPPVRTKYRWSSRSTRLRILLVVSAESKVLLSAPGKCFAELAT